MHGETRSRGAAWYGAGAIVASLGRMPPLCTSPVPSGVLTGGVWGLREQPQREGHGGRVANWIHQLLVQFESSESGMAGADPLGSKYKAWGREALFCVWSRDS